MFSGTKTLHSGSWAKTDQPRQARALGLKSTAKRLVMSVFRAIDRVPAETGVLLTFDDGPDPEVTPRVLELLAEFDAKAIFFVVGNRIPRAPELLRQIVDQGHWLGNHTFAHRLDYTPALAEYSRDVRACQRVIEETAGIRPTWFRPPMGVLTLGSLVGPWMAGLQSMLWSVDVGDWQLRSDGDAMAAGEQLAHQAAAGDIVLLHDDNRHVVTLLETALPQVAERFSLGAALEDLASASN